MKDLANLALDTARHKGASYADIRLITTESEHIQIRNGHIKTMQQNDTFGFGIRVLVNGAWGFASCTKVTKPDIERISALAVQIARASAALKEVEVRLAPEKPIQDFWHTPYQIDPFTVPMNEKVSLLLAIDHVLRRDKNINSADSGMSFKREHQWLATSEGAFIEQVLLRSGAGYSATALKGNILQTRSYPAAFGGQYASMGYELIPSLNLLGHAERIRDEAVALLRAPECPSGKMDLILGGWQLALQIHESVGHPTELDRVFGTEESYAGRSFLTIDKYKNFRFGSPIVNLVADGTLPAGLATIGYDDDGVPTQRWHLVQNGMFVGYQTNREFAARIGESSRGCCRADGFTRIPLIRNNNISLMPGTWTLDDLIKDTKHGIFMDYNRSWSIDQMRLNFQFGCEIGWEIKNGRKVRMVRNPNYQGITPEFWNACDAICDEKHWIVWGVANCGKAEPPQTAEMSHGASPTRFRNITVGVK